MIVQKSDNPIVRTRYVWQCTIRRTNLTSISIIKFSVDSANSLIPVGVSDVQASYVVVCERFPYEFNVIFVPCCLTQKWWLYKHNYLTRTVSFPVPLCSERYFGHNFMCSKQAIPRFYVKFYHSSEWANCSVQMKTFNYDASSEHPLWTRELLARNILWFVLSFL